MEQVKPMKDVKPGRTAMVRQFCYIHRSGDRVFKRERMGVRIITRTERDNRGYMYVGRPISKRVIEELTQLMSPKNQDIYFWAPDIL